MNAILHIKPPDERTVEWWALATLECVEAVAHSDATATRGHVHARLEDNRTQVRIWIDRGSSADAGRSFGAIVRAVQDLDVGRRKRAERRDALEDTVAASNAKERIAQNDLRYVLESKGLKADTLDVEIRSVEVEIEAWTTERAAARARRGSPDLTDDERAPYDRYLAEADAALERLTARLAVVRQTEKRVQALGEEVAQLRERKSESTRLLAELELESRAARGFMRVEHESSKR